MDKINTQILEDLANREVNVVMLLVETKEDKLQFMQYDSKGNIIFLSDPVEDIQVNEILQGRLVKPLFSFGKK